MPEALFRDERETSLANDLLKIWTVWSDQPSPLDLHKQDLLKLFRLNLTEQVSRIWTEGFSSVSEQFGLDENRRRAAAILVLFLTQMFDDLADSWSARVDDYVFDHLHDRKNLPEWKDVSGPAPEGIEYPANRKQSGPAFSEDPYKDNRKDSRKRPEMQSPVGRMVDRQTEILVPPTRRFEPLIRLSDTRRQAVDMVTRANTRGERDAVRSIHRKGIARVVAIWMCEVGACDQCSPFDQMPERYWSRYAPDGPGLHSHCRCWLRYVEIAGSNRRSRQPRRR